MIKRIDRYQVVRLLGSGGMGEVYQAQDPRVDRLIAIKWLKESLNTDEFRERFLHEAQAVAKLEHHNVVKVFDVRMFRGRPFIAMEYISGPSLAQVIARAEPMSVQQKLEVLEELCGGLAWAHAAGIVHRDVKPGNVMLDGRGHVKIVDFGIAKSDSRATSEQISMGTPCYMSPEQLRQQAVDHRTDMFSAAVVGYELLTYRKLFEGDAVQQVSRVLSGHIPPMPAGSVPFGVERVIRRALATQPGDRFKDMVAMQSALAAVRGQIPEPVFFGSGHHASSSDTLPAGEFPSIDPVAETLSSAWLPRVAVGAGAVCALALGGWLLLSKSPSDKTPLISQPPPSTQQSPDVGHGRPISSVGGSRGGNSKPSPPKVITKETNGSPPNTPPEPTGTPPNATTPPNGITPPNGDGATPTNPGLPGGPDPANNISVPPTPTPSKPEPLLVSASRILTPDDDASIRTTLRAYEAAFDKKIAASVKEVRPSLTSGEAVALDSEFLNAQSYHLEISKSLIVPVTQSRVQVNCTITRRIVPKQGDARNTVAVASIQLVKADDRWVITEISEREIRR